MLLFHVITRLIITKYLPILITMQNYITLKTVIIGINYIYFDTLKK